MKKLWWRSWFLIVHLVTDIVVNAVNKTMNQGELATTHSLRRREKKSVHQSGWNEIGDARNQGRSPTLMVLQIHRIK